MAALDELLKMEQDYERAAYSRSLSVDNISGRVCEADCKYPVTISGFGYNALSQLILTVAYECDGEELENDFEPGRPVAFFHLTQDGTGVVELPYVCFVDSYTEGVLQIQLPNKGSLSSLQDKSQHALLGVRAAIDDTSYRVMGICSLVSVSCRLSPYHGLTLVRMMLYVRPSHPWMWP